MSEKALTVGAFGARGTGKTAWMTQQIEKARPPRLLIWDYKDDPPIAHLGDPVHSIAELARLAKHGARDKFRLRYVVDQSGKGQSIAAQFEWFCRIAYESGNLLMYVAELPEVTAANKAPQAWRRCVNVGRLYKLRGEIKTLAIFADGQRFAEVDKSFLNNCDVLHCGRGNNLADAKLMGDTLGVNYRDLLALPDLHWIEKRAGVMEPQRGILKFTKKSAPAARPR